ISLTSGATLIINDKHKTFDVIEIADLIVKNNVTFTYIPPSLLKHVYKELKEYKCKVSLNKLLVGVESILGETLTNFYNINEDIEIVNGYGPTESTICSTLYKVKGTEVSDKPVPIGAPLRNIKAYILDNALNIVPIGVYGELCISGDGLARGYLNNKELTEEKFVDNPYNHSEKMYKTGDLARWLPDGNIEFLGRIDNQVKIRGFRIELGEIENKLRRIDYIEDVVVIKREDASGEKAIYSYIVSDINIDFKKVKKEIRKELPDYMIPAYMMQIEEIPVNRNGKLDKRALP
ncbi:amino acid adenylation domain-containing protein, partial [Clostridium gasigenes]|uniref:amino acid adenylation domain-containing protein n=1 Tax=Clostridium gasigenes TaxID=94869 RepID=UPI001C0E14C8